MELHLKIIGSILLLLALVHVIFPKYFNWKQELSTLSLINKEVMYVHTFFIALVIFLIGLLCVFYPHEICSTSLGKAIALGLFIFWFCRLLFQFFVYSSSLWKGKKFETFVHVVFSFLWSYISLIFFLVCWN
ncbi:hypothetical protein [Flavobacterium sp.]|uniref:hypothetical protein n=1 Tax=Flavobacterium sp. TaxID=239 RepID=UPI00261E20F4|nr:hypothetical protein [Flavobacterium sp.]